jgi:hypothetical protein
MNYKSMSITPEQLASSGTEHGHQAAIFCWANQNLYKYPVLKYLFAVPNGFYGSAAQKGKIKAEGLKSGVPDIWLPVKQFDTYNQLWKYGLIIEFKIPERKKNKDGGVEKEQKDWLAFLQSQGYQCWVCYGWEEAVSKIVEYLEE